jgi:hypothetical protein
VNENGVSTTVPRFTDTALLSRLRSRGPLPRKPLKRATLLRKLHNPRSRRFIGFRFHGDGFASPRQVHKPLELFSWKHGFVADQLRMQDGHGFLLLLIDSLGADEGKSMKTTGRERNAKLERK